MNYHNAVVKVTGKYGYDAQSRQLIEEMAELTKALNKFWRKRMDCGNKDFERNCEARTKEELDIIDEAADVRFCLDQIEYFFRCEDEVKERMEYKAERQIKRMSAGL